MWESLCAMTDRVDLLSDERLATFAARQEHTELIREALSPWFAEHSRIEADEAARSLRVPLAVVCDPLDLLDQESFRARRLFVPVESGTAGEVLVPGVPYLADGLRRGGGRVAQVAAETPSAT